MALVVEDTFTDTGGDFGVTFHTGETGATWARHAASVAEPVLDTTNDELRTANTTANQWVYPSGTASSADQMAYITFRNRSSAGTGAVAAVALRGNTSGAVNGYFLFYTSSATPFFRLYKYYDAGPSITQIGSDYTYTLPASEETISFYVVGSELRAYKGDGTLMITGTDSTLTSAGRPLIRFSDYATSTAGVNISRFQVYDGVTLPAQSAVPERAGSKAIRGLYVR